MSKVVGTIEYTAFYSLTQQEIDDLLVTAFEGGITYWCRNIKVNKWPEGARYASDVPSRGGVLTIAIDEVDDLGDVVEYQLTLDDVIRGIKMFCESRMLHPETLFGDFGDYDAIDADCIVQFAVFGEIVYG